MGARSCELKGDRVTRKGPAGDLETALHNPQCEVAEAGDGWADFCAEVHECGVPLRRSDRHQSPRCALGLELIDHVSSSCRFCQRQEIGRALSRQRPQFEGRPVRGLQDDPGRRLADKCQSEIMAIGSGVRGQKAVGDGTQPQALHLVELGDYALRVYGGAERQA